MDKDSRQSHAQAVAMLLLATMFWGVSFPMMRGWQQSAEVSCDNKLLASFTLIAVRMVFAVPLLIAYDPRVIRLATKREHGIGALLAVFYFMASVCQTLGLAWTTPALSAFITSTCSIWSPLMAFAVFGVRFAPITLMGLTLAIGGTALLTMPFGANAQTFGKGETLTLAGAILFSVQLILLDRWGRLVSSAHTSLAFFATTGLLAIGATLITASLGKGVGAWWDWFLSMLSNARVQRELVVLIILCTVFAFHWMNSFQPRVSVAEAALIYLTEPIFTSVFSIGLGYEEFSWMLVGGGTLIIGGNLLAEMPRLWRRGVQ